MLLRIIDVPAVDNGQDAVQIILEKNGAVESFVTSSYTSPFTDNFRKTLSWYFIDYLQCAVKEVDNSSVVEKLIKFGQYIGDELLGEDHQLLRLKQSIEKGGYQNLQVHIESTRIKFFKELWEVAILPESKYVLSAVVNSYVRQFVQNNFPNNYSELRYDLKITPPTQDKVTRFLQGDQLDGREYKQKNNNPLRILYLVSRPEMCRLPFSSSNSINMSLSAIASGGAIDYEVHQAINWEQLQSRLTDKIKPVHIFHYDGPVMLENGVAHFSFTNSPGADTFLSVTELVNLLVENKVSALTVDARIYLKNNQLASAEEGLAIIAQSAHRQGLGNVIGLGQITNPWVSNQCFQTFYSKITQGFNLAQAVVESRKSLQATIETSLMTAMPVPFHPWSLLIHYGKQSVTFFEAPQALIDPNTPQDVAVFHEKLFGFRSEMLPPLLNQVSDGQALLLIDKILNAKEAGDNQSASIIGEPGSGKTQLAHITSLYFAQKKQIDYGFYFNFTNDFFTPNDMLEMIGPILDLGVNQKAQTEEKLTHLRCCFVLDDISHNVDQSNESWATLSNFLKKLVSCGNILIVTGKSHSPLHDLAFIKIIKAPLLLVEQKIFAANILRQLDINEEKLMEVGQDAELESLLISLDGNPWLTKKVIPLLRSMSTQELKTQVIKHIDSKQKDSINQYYEWQWAELKPIWQRLLILCSDVRNLLLEMLMTVTEQKESFGPVKELFSMLGDMDARFSDGLDVWETAGFLHRLPHGRTVDLRCLNFLETKREACFDGIDQQKLNLHFSQLICEGIRILAQYMVKQPNPAISNNLLFNRRHWVKHFENLWFNQDYKGFIAVKSTFDQLLLQAKLENESKAWSLDLLERSPPITITEDSTAEEKLCWLLLATSVLDQAEAKNSSKITSGALAWRSWFNLYLESVDKYQLPLFHQVATFLEYFYRSQSQWHDCIIICEKTCAIYTENGAWKRVIQSYKSLSRYYVELSEMDQALDYENKIINNIPYADSPPGFQAQQMLDILFARILRADTHNARILLNDLREVDGAEKLTEVLDGAQCDINYRDGNYLAALPYYCKIWTRAIQTNQTGQIEQLKLRLVEIEQKIGLKQFDEYFNREVPDGTLKPRDYVSSLH